MWPGSSPSAVVNSAASMTIAALLIAGLYAGQDLLIPLALAGLLGFVLAPLVRRLETWGLPNGLAVATVIGALLAALFGGATIAGRQVGQLLEQIPAHEANLREKARFLHFELGSPGIWQRAAATLRNIEQEVSDPQSHDQPLQVQVAQNSEAPLVSIFEYIRRSVPSLVTGALALLLTVFVLLQYRDLRDRAAKLMGTEEIGRSAQVFDDAASDLGHYLFLQAAVNIAFGTFVGIALWIIGLPSPALWGAMTAILRFVPYIGAFIAAAFPLALAAMIDPGWWKLAEVAAIFVIGDPLLGQIVEPLLFGSQTRLSPLAVLLAIAFWTLLWGPLGLVVAVPLTLAIVVMGQHLPRLEFLRVLLGNEPVLKPHEQLYHQLLAGEAHLAAKDADLWIGEKSLLNYLDEAVIPSFRMATDDQRRGVLGSEQTEQLRESIAEYIGLVKEAIEYKIEPEPNPATSDTAKGDPPEAAPHSAPVLVLAGRGAVDLAACELIADAIRLEHGIGTRCASLGGLTGISAAAEAAPDDPPDVIALVSVGAVTRAQLDILLRRLRRSFPRSHIVIGYWNDPSTDGLPAIETKGIRYAQSVSELVADVRRETRERPAQTQSVRYLERAVNG
jgi:predicted PurR-regulated permease PerM